MLFKVFFLFSAFVIMSVNCIMVPVYDVPKSHSYTTVYLGHQGIDKKNGYHGVIYPVGHKLNENHHFAYPKQQFHYGVIGPHTNDDKSHHGLYSLHHNDGTIPNGVYAVVNNGGHINYPHAYYYTH